MSVDGVMKSDAMSDGSIRITTSGRPKNADKAKHGEGKNEEKDEAGGGSASVPMFADFTGL